MDIQQLGRALVVIGLTMAALGALALVIGRAGGGFRLPGDIVIRRPGVTLYVPLGTSLALSLLLTLGALLWRLWRR